MTADIVRLPGGAEPLPVPNTLSLVRLLRLASPALPVGAFAYSQGLETAITEGWVHDEDSIGDWICDGLEFNLARFEAPVLHRLMLAWSANDLEEVRRLNDWFLAARETAEFRAETAQMGHALRRLFEATKDFAAEEVAALRFMEPVAFPAVFAFAAARWRIDPADAISAYLFAWAENQVNAAMKAVRPGHVGAQRILARVSAGMPEQVERAMRTQPEEISNCTPALAIAGCLHELQDSRVFRS
ncbi:MAG: urease accessory protein UreF [Burkholderiales bacterium]|nr:urease accessory protein UreF [Burkholderiales bacterium]